MGWLELAKEKERELYEAACEAIESAINDRSGAPNRCCGVQLFEDGRVTVAVYSDFGFPVSVHKGINLYNVRCDLHKDPVEDIGDGNEAAERVMAELPRESKAVMRVLREKYGAGADRDGLYRNRFFEILSQMFFDEYEEYRSAAVKAAAKRAMKDEAVLEEIFARAEAADSKK